MTQHASTVHTEVLGSIIASKLLSDGFRFVQDVIVPRRYGQVPVRLEEKVQAAVHKSGDVRYNGCHHSRLKKLGAILPRILKGHDRKEWNKKCLEGESG